MRTLAYLQTSLLTFFSLILWSQDTSTEREGGHLNNNKFKHAILNGVSNWILKKLATHIQKLESSEIDQL